MLLKKRSMLLKNIVNILEKYKLNFNFITLCGADKLISKWSILVLFNKICQDENFILSNFNFFKTYLYVFNLDDLYIYNNIFLYL